MAKRRRKLSKKQIAAGFGGKRRKASTKRRRPAKRKTTRRRRKAATKPRRRRNMARRRRRGRKKRGIPSIASIIVALNAASTLGLIDALAAIPDPNKSIVDAADSITRDPMQLIDAIVPAILMKFARKFVGPVSAGPIRIL